MEKPNNSQTESVKRPKSIVKKQGVVVSDAADKSVAVLVKTKKPHPIYGKLITKTRKYQVHDPENQYKVGDKVIIKSIRPVSKLKHFAVEGMVKSVNVTAKKQSSVTDKEDKDKKES